MLVTTYITIFALYLLPKSIKIQTYKTINLQVFCMGVKPGHPRWGRNTDWRFLRAEWLGEYLELREISDGGQEKNYTLIRFTICALQQTA